MGEAGRDHLIRVVIGMLTLSHPVLYLISLAVKPFFGPFSLNHATHQSFYVIKLIFFFFFFFFCQSLNFSLEP